MSLSPSRFRLGCVAAALGIASVTLTAAAGAQTQPAKEKAGESAIAVEGCLTKQGPQGTSTAAEQFVLVLPEQDARSGGTPTGGAAPAPPQPKMYALKSADKTTIAFPSFVNQRVKVEGTTTAAATSAPLAGRSPEATPYPAPVASGGATPTEPTGTPFDRANLPSIAVRTLTSVAATCK